MSGVVSGSSVTFTGVPTAPGPFTLTITNIRIDASQIAQSIGAPTAVTETVFVGGPNVTPAVLPVSNVAFATNGLTGVRATNTTSTPVCSALTSASPNFNVQFSESFAAAFEVQGSATVNSTLASQFANGSETGYGISAGGGTNTATSGTRVKIVVNNIPAGNVSLFAPVTLSAIAGEP